MKKTSSVISTMLLIMTSIISIAFLTFNGQIPQAEAINITVSGRVTTSINTSVSGATVYLEAPYNGGTPQQPHTTTDAFGNWSISLPSGYTYTVDASKYGSQRARYPSTITTTTSNVNLTINPQTTATLNMFITADEEFRSTYGASWQSTEWSKITTAQSIYRDNWNINFADTFYSSAWTSPNGVTDCTTLMNDAGSDTGWSSGSHQGANILFMMTGQSLSLEGSAAGCADIGSLGAYPRTIVQGSVGGMQFVVAHELGHIYGFSHHSVSYYCLMNTGAWPSNNTFEPSYDHAMALRTSPDPARTWY